MDIDRLPTRIHIMGGAGSGKTTLARRLSSRLDVPCYYLDHIAYEKVAWRKIALGERVESLRRIIAQPGWITEGAFLWWTEPLLEAADLIVWLDLPFHISGWRIVKRHVQLSWAGANPHPGTMNLLRFMGRIFERQTRRTALVPTALDDDAATTRVAEAEILSHYAEKVIHCTTPADVAKIYALAEHQ